MPNMKKKICDSSGNVDNGVGDLKPKERHIVSWSKEEDDILREQIHTHGTDNWTIIASKFENKTTRQCRRRWFTYLNSDVKKGGWSPEEDMLLCEDHLISEDDLQAQKMFGNRWTEIAKVVSGRTDNAVKNRFSVLRKRKAKHEESTKENNANERTSITVSGVSESVHPMKMRRKHIATTSEASNIEEGLIGESLTANTQLRPPLMVLMRNCNNTNTSPAQLHANSKKASLDVTHEVEPTPSEPIYPKSLVDGRNIGATNKDILPSTNEMNNDVGGVCPLPSSEFNSPLQVTRFRSMAQGIPSPHFSESEKSFLLKTLGMESTPPNTTAGTSQSPPCKRALLHCL